MRKLFISDIHGQYHAMLEVLKEANYNPVEDMLIVGGDMIDRGPDSGKVIRYLKSLKEAYRLRVVILAGNHEDMLKDFLEETDSMWLSHGQEALESFRNEFTSAEEFTAHMAWIVNLPFMHGDDEFIYVHAGINPERAHQDRREALWMPYCASGKRFDSYDRKDILRWTGDRKVVHGHTPKRLILDDGARINCDLGASIFDRNAKLALVNLSDNTHWYYDFNNDTVYKDKIEKKVEPKQGR